MKENNPVTYPYPWVYSWVDREKGIKRYTMKSAIDEANDPIRPDMPPTEQQKKNYEKRFGRHY